MLGLQELGLDYVRDGVRVGLASRSADHFRFYFAYTDGMDGRASTLCDFVIRCKRCETNVPAPVRTLPDIWIVVTCPVCGAREQYLSTEIFQGRVSFELLKKPVCSAAWW